MGLQLVTPPAAGEPISLNQAKDHLHIPQSDISQDTWIGTAITAARMIMESSRYPGLDICFKTQTWNLILDSFPPDGTQFIEIPKRPVQSVASITYVDIAGNSVVWPNTNYKVDPYAPLGNDTGPTRIAPVQAGSAVGVWPTVTPGVSLQAINGVIVQFVAGYGTDVTLVPAPLQLSMLMLMATLFENREATGDVGDVPNVPNVARMVRVPVTVPFGYDMLTNIYRGDGIA